MSTKQAEAEVTDTWILTYTGRKFWADNPKVESICIEDIAHALSLICRFNGHCERHYSVAQHCLVGYGLHRDMSPEIRLYILLHDAAEAYMCDIPRPIKPLIKDYKGLHDRLLDTIFEYAELPKMPDDVAKIVHEFDNRVVVTEAEQLFGDRFSVFKSCFDYDVEPYKNVDLMLDSAPKDIEEYFTYAYLMLQELRKAST